MYCLDANVWIYFLDSNLQEHEHVYDEVSTVVGSKPLFSPTVLQMEAVHYITNQLSDPERAVEQILSAEDVQVADLTKANVRRATELLQEFDDVGIGGRDASVLASMERHDVARLWTHDEALLQMDDRLDWLDVYDPVSG